MVREQVMDATQARGRSQELLAVCVLNTHTQMPNGSLATTYGPDRSHKLRYCRYQFSPADAGR